MNWNYEDGRIYSKNEKNELMAEVTYEYIGDDEVNINHTYVNPVLRGQGVAGELLRLLAEHLRKSGLKATATCTYAISWLNRHEDEYADIISDLF
jgi:predicted GNAT family acetyltransferase